MTASRSFMVVAWSLLTLGYACDHDTSAWLPVGERAADSMECRVADDCTLMPSAITCCGECDPVPPFQAVPHTDVDAWLIEVETRCAGKPPACDPPSCEAAPPGCEAHAACVSGHCMVVANDACRTLVVAAIR